MAGKIKIEDVRSVYSGKVNTCACGCSGNHRYAAKFAKEAGIDRGYAVDSEEISDRSVAIIVGKINKAIEAGEETIEALKYFAYETNTRLYVAYLSAAAVAARTEELVVIEV